MKSIIKKDKAITLVALVITIIILLILAGITIAQLTGNGLLEKTLFAKEKYSISEAKEKIEFAITELRIEQEEKGKDLEKDDLIKLNNEELEVKSTENFPVEVIYDGYVFNIDEQFNVTYVRKANGTVVTYTTEPEGYIKEGTIVIKLTFSNSNGISKIQNPKGTINNCNGKNVVAIDYSVTENGTYTFKITDKDGNETVKDIIINNFDTEAAIIENQEIGVSTGYKLKVKARDELSGLKRITVVAKIKSDTGTEKTNTETKYFSGEYQKEKEIDLGLSYNYTLTAYTIEVEDQAGNVKTYNSTVELPITNTIYRITTEDELIYFRQLLKRNHFKDQTVYLENDITLTEEIGPLYSSYFSGTFEGNNHKISNISFYYNGYTTLNLFGGNEGTIQNLKIELNVVNTIGDTVSGIVSYNSGKIINCHSSGTITFTGGASYYAGGLVDSNSAGGLIEKCSNSAIIDAPSKRQIGGIVDSNRGTIRNCYNTGNISGNWQIGGIVGQNYDSGIIVNCYNRGIISAGYGSGAGGICGTGSMDDNSSNNYYLNTSATGGYNEEDIEGKAEAKTEQEMKSDAFITLLNAGGDNWKRGDDGYPTIK